MIYRSTQEDIQNYFDSPALNQSTLKIIERGVSEFLEAQATQDAVIPDYLKIGSAVDCILTEGEEAFQAQFYVSTLDKTPSDGESKVLAEVKNQVAMFYTGHEKEPLESYRDAILTAVNACDYQKNWKDETRVNKIIANCSDYWTMLTESDGKIILTEQDSMTIRDAVNRVQNSPIFDESLNPRKFADQPSDHICFQLPIFFTYKGVDCKAMLDCVRIYEHESQLEIYPFDLKTTSGMLINFPNTIKRFRYDIQAQFYREALMEFAKRTYPHATSIRIHDFSFVAVSTTEHGYAAMFTLTSDYYTNELVDNKDRMDLNQMMDKYIYQTQNGFENDMEIMSNDYKVTLCS